MKRILLLAFLTVSYFAINAQVLDSTGRSHVNFNIDGDTRNNYQKYSSSASASYHDDWFLQDGYQRYDAVLGARGIGNSVFDTIGTAAYKAQLAANQNISFVKRMKYAAFDVVPMWRTEYGPFHADSTQRGFDSSFWVDGVYFRDYAGGTDATAFGGSKSQDDPNNWVVGNSVSGKSDIIDVMTHVRTSGLNPVTDSVWFFAGISVLGTSGTRFFDIEVYREAFSYNESTKKFTSAGKLNGHSPWTFESPSGKVTRSGDIIINVAYPGGRAPEIDFRIFIAKTTYDSVVGNKLNPATFKIETKDFQLNTAGTGGYALISSKSGITNWGSGVANYSKSAQDTTLGPPWGTLNSSGNYSTYYDQLQYVEIALNFSRFGMNPFHYVESHCSSPYSSIIIKSKSSNSSSASLEDFVIPQPFSVKNIAPYTVTPEIITCTKTNAKLSWNYSARNYYKVIDPDGVVVASNQDFRTIPDKTLTMTKPGTYKIEATNFIGCPAMESKFVTVQADTTAPTARAVLGHGQPYYFLDGTVGSTGLSFGTTSLSYSWVGPITSSGTPFTSTLEDPKIGNTLIDVPSGDYTLTVTQARNGCKASSTFNVNMIVLASNAITLQGKLAKGKAKLNWNTPDVTQAPTFEIERSSNSVHFVKVAHIKGSVGTKQYSFMESEHITGTAQYRIKSTINGSAPTYSNIISLLAGNKEKIVMTRQTSANRLIVQLGNAVTDKDVQIKVLTMDGRLLLQNTYPGQQAGSRNALINLSLPASIANQPVIVSIYQDSYLLEARKL